MSNIPNSAFIPVFANHDGQNIHVTRNIEYIVIEEKRITNPYEDKSGSVEFGKLGGGGGSCVCNNLLSLVGLLFAGFVDFEQGMVGVRKLLYQLL